MSDFFYEYRDGKSFKVDKEGYKLSIKGKRISSFLESDKVFSIEEIYFIAEQLLDVLGSMRSTFPPIVHTNINPVNIIVKPNWEIALMGFGANKGIDKYRAPEVLEQKTPKADLYSVGKVLNDLSKNINDENFNNFLALMFDENMDFRFNDINTAKKVFNKLKDNSVTNDDFNMKKDENKTSAYDQYLIEKKSYRRSFTRYDDLDEPVEQFSVENYEDGGELSLGKDPYEEKSFSDKYVRPRRDNRNRMYSPLVTLFVAGGFFLFIGISFLSSGENNICDLNSDSYNYEKCEVYKRKTGENNKNNSINSKKMENKTKNR